jgi:hypothetical protein
MRGSIATLVLAVAFALSPSVASAQEFNCPEHGYASCYQTGEYRNAADGHGMHKWSCSCGDKWWVRDE